MPARKSYSDFYEDGSAARKREYKLPEKKVEPRRQVRKNSNMKTKKVAKKNMASKIVFILCAFTMTMVITYRFNVINEKNLESQQLKKELAGVETGLLNQQIEVEQGTDLNKIEAYAKQQLGMQKPDKNQTIYVDTSKSNQTIEIKEDTTVLQNIINSIKNAINSIF